MTLDGHAELVQADLEQMARTLNEAMTWARAGSLLKAFELIVRVQMKLEDAALMMRVVETLAEYGVLHEALRLSSYSSSPQPPQ